MFKVGTEEDRVSPTGVVSIQRPEVVANLQVDTVRDSLGLVEVRQILLGNVEHVGVHGYCNEVS